jgi:mannose-1-phosphate guanylyltransferase
LAEHKAKGAIASVVAMDVPRLTCRTMALWLQQKTVALSRFRKSPVRKRPNPRWASTGIYIFEPEALDLIPSGKMYDIGSSCSPNWWKNLPFYAQKRPFHWLDIGRVSDYWSVLQSVLNGEWLEMKMPGREIKPGIWVGLNTSIPWDKVKIHWARLHWLQRAHRAGATIIGPAWIGHGCVIRSGAKVTRSILFEYTRIAADMHFNEMIVSRHYCVDRHGDTLYRGDETAQLRWGDARA